MTAENIVTLLKEKQLTVATAESCTAGLLSTVLTTVSGVSAVFECGISAYSADIKHQILGVPTEILEEHGTVSAQTAAAMANGVRRLANSAIGVAITGVAGPNETEGKPVGRVHIALANDTRVWLEELQPNPELSREEIRRKAVNTALKMIWAYADAYPTLNAGSIPLTTPTTQEIVIPETPQKKQRRFLSTLFPWAGDTLKERLIKSACWLILLAISGVSIFGIHRLITLSDNKSLYSDLQDMYVNEHEENTDEKGFLPRFNSLYLQNADIGGWIRIEGTAINYPVMKNAGSDYYATHNFRQEHSSFGTPYFDKQNNLMSPDAHNQVLIVYGNNTGDGQMFSKLTSYRYTDFFSKQYIVDMSTLYTADKWLLFGVMVLDPNEINAFDYTNIDFKEESAFTQYINEITKRSLFNTDIDVNDKDDLLLLVTRADEEYGFDNALLVVAGRRMRSDEIPPSEITVLRNNTVVMPRKWVYANRNTTTKRTTATTTDTQETTTSVADDPLITENRSTDSTSTEEKTTENTTTNTQINDTVSSDTPETTSSGVETSSNTTKATTSNYNVTSDGNSHTTNTVPIDNEPKANE